MACERLAPALLAHVNLLLALYAGAALVTAARLKWDPSTYIAVRQLFPLEYHVAAAGLAAAGGALLALGHLAAAALAARRAATRRLLLVLYALLMVVLMCGEVAWGAWLAVRMRDWLRSERARTLLEALDLREHLRPILNFFSNLHPVPQRIKELMEEAEADAPRNLYAAAAGGALLAALQPLAVALALLLAARARPHPRPHPRTHSLSCATTATTATVATATADHEKAPLRTAYRNGRIVVL